jgi:hypothetical protein
MKRIASGTSANVRLERWVKNKKQQQWFFDPVSKLIRSNYWKNYCIEIPSSGNANDLRMTASFNSRHW